RRARRGPLLPSPLGYLLDARRRRAADRRRALLRHERDDAGENVRAPACRLAGERTEAAGRVQGFWPSSGHALNRPDSPERRETPSLRGFLSMRLGGFEPPTHGLEGRRSVP